MDRFRLHASIDTPGPSPHGLAFDGENLWLSDASERRIYKINPENGQVLVTIPFDGDVAGCAWDGSHLWQADNRTRTISQIDPETGTVGMSVACDTQTGVLGGLCFAEGDLWLAVTGVGQLRRIRAADGVILKAHPVAKNILGLGFDGRRIWYTDVDTNRVRLVDPPTGTELMSYELDGTPTGLAFTGEGGQFWYADVATKKLHLASLIKRS